MSSLLFRIPFRSIAILLLLIIFPFASSRAATFFINGPDSVKGDPGNYKTEKGESLIEIAGPNGLGYNEIVDANPGIYPFVPGEGTEVVLPTIWVLPENGNKKGILINLSEMRLYHYYYINGIMAVDTFPVGIGTDENNTPTGVFTIVEKIINPAWHVPESIRRENPDLPKVVPPGPDNPLGTHAMRLSKRTILIHGTNRPFAVGRLASHGCLRLYPDDIKRLFDSVNEGTVVRITRQPVKIGIRADRIFIEVHRDDPAFDYFGETMRLLHIKDLASLVNAEKMFQALGRKDGLPADITE